MRDAILADFDEFRLAQTMSLLAFILAALLLAITPGPGIAYVVGRTVARGRAEGLASCLGTALGGLVHRWRRRLDYRCSLRNRRGHSTC